MYCFYEQGQHLLDFRVMLSTVSQSYTERIASAPMCWGFPKVKMYKPISFPFFSMQPTGALLWHFCSASLFTRGSTSWRLTSLRRGCGRNPRSEKWLLHFAFGGARVQGHSALFQGRGPDLCVCPLDNARLCSSSKASLLSHAVPKELCR